MAAFQALEHISYSEYLLTGHWAQIRRAALWHAGGRCQVCGSNRELEVHHRDYDCLFKERPEDLVVLCRNCHEVFSSTERIVQQQLPARRGDHGPKGRKEKVMK